MSYYPPQGAPPPQGYPSYPGHSPQPPYQQYPPPPPPQQQQHGYGYGQPPQQPYQQPGYGPPGGYPPQGNYGPPPQGAPYGGAPPLGQYQSPPPQPGYGHQPSGYPPQGFPPQQGYQQPPYGAPPQQHGYGAPPPSAPYGAPPSQQYGAAPAGAPTPPSLGYVPGQLAPVDMTHEAEALRKAMKGFGTDEAALIRTLARPDPLQMAQLRKTFHARFSRDLVRDIEKETSGYFEKGLVALVRGPLSHDAHVLYSSMKGLGTRESALNDVLIGRSNADINAIKMEYQQTFRKSLESDLRGDLSLATEEMFMMIIAGRRNEDSAPVLPQQIDQDVHSLQASMGNGSSSKDAVAFCNTFLSRSDPQIKAIAQAYQQKYSRSLELTISSKFSGHMKDALLLHLKRAVDRPLADAELLEAAMAGLGTKDQLLVDRVVRAHWNKQHLNNVKIAYRNKYRRDLSSRIKGETSGDYGRLMVALVES